VILADGDNGLGIIVGVKAMREAIRAAKQHGVALATARNSGHFGAAGYYARLASARGFIGLVCSNAGPAMAPWGSLTPYLGTNPMAFAAPGGLEDGVTLDMATSQVASGKVNLARLAGRLIPLNWATDSLGRPTDDPATALAGLMQPLGGYKGYGLALMIEILAGVLAGAAIGPHLFDGPSNGRVSHNVGHFFMALDVELFMPLAEFEQRMRQMADEIHQAELAPGAQRVYLPGEIERETAERREREGIPCPKHLIADLKQVGEQVGELFRC
jgi:LDH2 family malate/lactate/ureidoglycolate dehydrogenase